MLKKNIIILMILILGIGGLVYIAQANWFVDFFDRFTLQEEMLSANPQALPKWVTTTTDQFGNTIDAIRVRGNKDVYIIGNATTTGSSYAGGDITAGGSFYGDGSNLTGITGITGGWATSSSDYWLTIQDTADLTEGTNLYFTDARVADYVNASTTMPVGNWNDAYSWGDWSGEGFITLTSLSGSSPIDYNNGTGDFSFDFSLDNTWTGGNIFTITTTTNATTTGSSYVGDDLTVVGTASTTQLHVGGNGTIEGTLNVSGTLTADLTGAVTGAASGNLLNSESDTLIGTLTADGLTLGSTEILTIGTNLFTHDGTDFTLDDTLVVTGYASSTLGLNTQGTLHIGGNSTFDGTGHDSFSDYVADEHLNWKNSVGTIHADNYTNTTYTGGINLTLDGTAFDVDDAFLVNDAADIGVGITLTYSTTTGTMTIPQGAAPEVTVIGQIALDSSDDQLIVMGATEKVIRTDEAIFRFTFASTSPDFVSGGELPVPPEKDGYTITSYSCYVTGGTSVVLTPNGASQGDLDAITCATTITKDTTMTAASIIAADELVKMKIGTVTGVPDYVSFTAFGKWTRE